MGSTKEESGDVKDAAVVIGLILIMLVWLIAIGHIAAKESKKTDPAKCEELAAQGFKTVLQDGYFVEDAYCMVEVDGRLYSNEKIEAMMREQNLEETVKKRRFGIDE